MLKPCNYFLLVKIFLVIISISFIFSLSYGQSELDKYLLDLLTKGYSLYMQGNSEEAITFYDEVIKIRPNIVYPLLAKGVALVELGKYEEAITWYDKALKIDADNVDGLVNKGVALVYLGRPQEALTLFNQALKVNPGDVNALIGKGGALDKLGKSQEAITWFDKALEIDPSNKYALNNKGNALNDLGKPREALILFTQGLTINPSNVVTLATNNFAMNGIGYTLTVLGKYEEAITWYDQALKINPGDTYALHGKGIALYNLGKYKEAITWYDQALKIDPVNIDILNNKAVAVSKLTPDFSDGDTKSPGTTIRVLYPSELSSAAITFVSVQDIRSFDIGSSSVSMTPNTIMNVPTVNNKIVNTIQEQTSDPTIIVRIQTGDSSTPFDEAIKLDPDNVQLLTNAGIYLADKKGMYNNAISLFDKVLKIDQKYVQAIYKKAETLKKLGRSYDAEKLFDTAKEFDPIYRGDYITVQKPPEASLAATL